MLTPGTRTKAVAAAGALAVTEARQLAASGAGQMIREAAGLSLAELGAAIGVDASTIFRWEEGSRRPFGENAVGYRDFLRQLREVHAAPLRGGGRKRGTVARAGIRHVPAGTERGRPPAKGRPRKTARPGAIRDNPE
jgi:DNA-binding XRE family transcriptional regulator